MGSTLLVASAGGHVEELHRLQRRLRVGFDRVWVTYDVPHARLLLDNEHVVFAHHPTTKSIHNAVRNYQLAGRVLEEHAPSIIISTGAAVAVPFFARAQRLGIPSHYIESAARVDGPSLSGQMLQRFPSVHLYRQLGAWGSPRWKQGPSVFDGFTSAHDESVGRALDWPSSRKLVASLGTHQFTFATLVERLRRVVPSDVAITWQLGSTTAPAQLPGRVNQYLSVAELRALVSQADVVVGHAGVGFALTALSMGKVPVLVPRRRRRSEHTDDHQVEVAGELDRRGLAVVAEVGELTCEHLQRAASRVVTYVEPPVFTLFSR